jgi:hypothetical protein
MADDGAQFRDEMSSKIREFAKNLKHLDHVVVDEFIASLCIKNNKVGGFKYIKMKEQLSEVDYFSLLRIVDFDPLKMADFIDTECNPRTGFCEANIGHACDPIRCRRT